tara:strand:+ start:41 stop:274 length:234 start_codon:yes stop_codon:yes gene_type:complete
MAKKTSKIAKSVKSAVKKVLPKKAVKKEVKKAADPDWKKYFKEVKEVGDRIEIKSHNGRTMDFKDMDSAISWAIDNL